MTPRDESGLLRPGPVLLPPHLHAAAGPYHGDAGGMPQLSGVALMEELARTAGVRVRGREDCASLVQQD